ncbi:hypothetical protein N9F76_00075 [bacterium]|nr:hypothetical protein [bacterium]
MFSHPNNEAETFVWPNISYTVSLVSWFPARVCSAKIEFETANWKTE